MNNIGEVHYGCTGCGVCVKACMRKCIYIKKNKEGFYEAIEDKSKCINCGICKDVCYKYFDELTNKEYSIYESSGFLAYSNNKKIRRESSSGGIATEISKWGVENGYNICGASYNYEENITKHIILNSVDEIKRISGSKYMPSYTLDAFKKLDKDKKYIIFCTPCQIYGLRKFVNRNKINKWILIDFFCHGTPSINLWHKYLEMIKKQINIKNIDNINFRDKKEGWHNYHLTISGEGKQYSKNFKEDIFFRCFLNEVDLNSSCYNCKLRFNKLFSDIRLGDFWGPKCLKDELGTSIILVNSQIGREILNKVENVYLEEVKFNDIEISQYGREINIPKIKSRFQKSLNTKKDLEIIYKRYVSPIEKKKKVIRNLKRIIRRGKKGIKWVIRS